MNRRTECRPYSPQTRTLRCRRCERLPGSARAGKRLTPLHPQWVPASAGTLTGLPTRFRVFYHCRKPGTVSLEAKLPLKGYNDVVWKWSKQCTDDVPVHLSVGTEERGEDIVTEGKVEAAWNATSPTVKFPPTQTLVTTHITTTEDQAFYEPEFEVEPPIATAVVEGHFDAAVATVPESFPHDQPVSFLAKNQHAPFVVRVSCHEPGLATVSARVRPYALYDGCGRPRNGCRSSSSLTPLPTARFRPLLIGWKHQCGGVPRPNLAIATQVLHEGVEEEDADVARNGAILPTWTQLNYTADAQQLCVAAPWRGGGRHCSSHTPGFPLLFVLPSSIQDHHLPLCACGRQRHRGHARLAAAQRRQDHRGPTHRQGHAVQPARAGCAGACRPPAVMLLCRASRRCRGDRRARCPPPAAQSGPRSGCGWRATPRPCRRRASR